ncbi:hypothetical protein PBI_ANDREW_70 [Arthrobacter phage Andrew]|uniref:Uncharacterized protein n=1 Tax=Arthrobacter phage Andrew TaxID=2419946 RepID=A0A3G2KD01_9CAUD|nr:hypothetical protein HOU53_gp70 [Arthrobacter phage Andrew]AYN56882.1 hypothetical protein PBI_ANDREW_70 [Arthrobacter phage Andrew]
MGKKQGPEVWHARVLRDEAEALAIACRMLEFQLGYLEGRATAEAAAVRAVDNWGAQLMSGAGR